jgi:hypothetical protein
VERRLTTRRARAGCVGHEVCAGATRGRLQGLHRCRIGAEDVRDAMRCDASVSGRYLARDMAGRRAAGGVATIAGRAKAKKMEEDVKIKARARDGLRD